MFIDSINISYITHIDAVRKLITAADRRRSFLEPLSQYSLNMSEVLLPCWHVLLPVYKCQVNSGSVLLNLFL